MRQLRPCEVRSLARSLTTLVLESGFQFRNDWFSSRLSNILWVIQYELRRIRWSKFLVSKWNTFSVWSWPSNSHSANKMSLHREIFFSLAHVHLAGFQSGSALKKIGKGRKFGFPACPNTSVFSPLPKPVLLSLLSNKTRDTQDFISREIWFQIPEPINTAV